MKKIKTLLFAAMIAATFGSCSKSDSDSSSTGGSGNTNTGGNNTPTYYMSCKVNGTLQEFKAMTLIKDNPANIQQLYLVGAANNSVLPTLTFTLNYKAPGWVGGLTYVLDETDLKNFVEYKSPEQYLFKSTAIVAGSGVTLKFDKIDLTKDSIATGTFSGSLQLEENTNTVQLSEGKFKMKFLN